MDGGRRVGRVFETHHGAPGGSLDPPYPYPERQVGKLAATSQPTRASDSDTTPRGTPADLGSVRKPWSKKKFIHNAVASRSAIRAPSMGWQVRRRNDSSGAASASSSSIVLRMVLRRCRPIPRLR